jgi:hypothetical protein
MSLSPPPVDATVLRFSKAIPLFTHLLPHIKVIASQSKGKGALSSINKRTRGGAINLERVRKEVVGSVMMVSDSMAG